jgi:hypothetical protein
LHDSPSAYHLSEQRAVKPLHKTGLPQFDQASFNKGLSDGFRGHTWWPGAGIEPLSYAAGYQESGVRNPRTQPGAVTGNEEAAPAAHLTESDLDSIVAMMQAVLSTSAPLSPEHVGVPGSGSA